MKKLAFLLILTIFCCQSCQKVEKVEAATEVGLLTNYNFEPQTLNGWVKSVSEKYYLVSEESGEFIKGKLLNDSLRKTISWALAFNAEYDEEGLITRIEYLDDSGVKGFWKTESENGTITKARWTSKGTVRSYLLIHSDEKGDMSLNLHETVKCIKFDEMGNWLQNVCWEDEVLTSLDERTITYYD